jgi:hypothetical protein
MYVMTIRTDQRLVHFRFRDQLTVSEFRRAFLDFVESPQFDPAFLMLTDTREVDELIADFKSMFNAVQGLSRAFARFDREAKCVLLVKGDMHFGMARMLEQIVEVFSPIRIRAVQSVAEASAFSELSLEALAEVLSGGAAEG